MELKYQKGIAWGEVKKEVYRELDNELKEKRKAYAYWMAHPKEIDQILHTGALQARKKARVLLQKIRRAIGIA